MQCCGERLGRQLEPGSAKPGDGSGRIACEEVIDRQDVEHAARTVIVHWNNSPGLDGGDGGVQIIKRNRCVSTRERKEQVDVSMQRVQMRGRHRVSDIAHVQYAYAA